MAYICGSSSIHVSLHGSGVYTTIHIRQHLDGMEETTGKTQINRDGLILTTDDNFAVKCVFSYIVSIK